MAIMRRVSYLSEMRLDTPDMRSIESAVSADFDAVAQSFIAGPTTPYVMSGFTISVTGAIGGASNGLQMVVAGGSLLHTKASQSGSFLMVPAGTPNEVLNSSTNTSVTGAFTPNSINYVGIDYSRFADPTTNVTRYIWDDTSKTESTTTAPAAQVLDYQIVITSSPWASNILPIAIITTDSNNNVVSITDARNQLFRLGQGGSSPNPSYIYPWSQGRTEVSPTTTSNSSDPFNGGDKNFNDLKDWMDAVMSVLKEIKGTTFWYSISSSGSLETLREDLGNTVITGRGHIAHGVLPADGQTPTAPGQINWDQDINIRVIGSEIAYTLSANPTSNFITLTEDQVAYITLVRDVVITPSLIFTNSSPTVVSVGGVSWTTPLAAGDWIKLSTDTNAGYYKILSVDSLIQVTLTTPYGGASTGVVGAKANYAFGAYNAVASPSGQRDIFIATRGNVPEGQNMFWLFLRSDNGGATPRVYIRFLGSELEEGVDRDISDTTPVELLQYIGSPSQAAFAPKYVAALTPGAVPQITQITTGSAATMASNQYFFIYPSSPDRSYYIWVKKNGAGTDPAPVANSIGLQWNITTGQTAAQTATTLRTLLNGTFFEDFSAAIVSNVLTVTNTSAGVTAPATNISVGAPFAISVLQSGTGEGNYSMKDGDNLTLAIKKIDDVIGSIISASETPGYDETVLVVVSGATPPTSINGPVSPGTSISLPLNSRMGNAVTSYVVGSGKLEVFLNGQKLIVGQDYSEVGTSGANSTTITNTFTLVVNDILEFTFGGGGASGGGGGQQGPAGPIGPTGPAGADAAGGPIAINTVSANYSLLSSDCFKEVNAAGGPVVITLPTAASVPGRIFYIKKIDATANLVTLQAFGSETIDGSNTQTTTTQWESFSVISNGTAWRLF